jgi:hypothetical protein
MIAQDPWRGLNGHVVKSLRLEQATRHFSARNPILRGHLRIFGDVELNTRLRVEAEQQARQHKHPEQRVLEHVDLPPPPQLATRTGTPAGRRLLFPC